MSENHFATFFKSLAERLYKEPLLSDFVWALTQTVPHFAKDFVQFFDPTFISDDPVFASREFKLDDGYVDWAFFCGDYTMFVENKIYDMDYHFEQYAKGCVLHSDAKLSLIANHYLDPDSAEKGKKYGWEIKTWSQYIYYLTKEKEYGEYQELIDAFIQYVKGVCNMGEIGTMKFDINVLKSLAYFDRIVLEIINRASSQSKNINYYEAKTRQTNESCVGRYYEFAGAKTAFPWFGISYDDQIIVSIDFDNWSWKIFEDLKRMVGQSGENYYVKDFYNGSEIAFCMSPGTQQRFLDGDKSEQIEILKIFFDEVNAKVEELVR